MEKKMKIVCGLTHVDLGWKKTREEMEEVFETYIVKLLDLCQQYPEFTHMLEQAYHYRGLKARRPDLFEKLVPLVASGRLEFVTGLASTIENNVTCGESFVRNMQIGRRFLEENFGVRVRDCTMIDTFGFPPQMPQVLSQMGYTRLLANRLGAIHTEDVMRAVGLDGTSILLAGSDLLAYQVKPGHVSFRFFQNYAAQERLFQDAKDNDIEPQIVIPYSENEVTPCRLVPEMVRKSDGEFRFGLLSAFFDELEKHADAYPEVFADMNPEFTGTFSQRHGLRIANRRAETLLLEAEKLSALHNFDARARIEECWWTLAYAQFHDVITGSHPTNVYVDCMEKLDGVCREAQSVIAECLCGDGSGWTVWNGLPFEREETICVALPEGWRGASAARLDGAPVEVFDGGDGCARLNLRLRPMAAHHLELDSGDWRAEPAQSCDVLENEWIRMEFEPASMIARMVYKPTGRVMMQNVRDLLVFQRDEGNFQIENPVQSEVCGAVGKFQHRLYRRGNCGFAEIEGYIPDRDNAPVRYWIVLSLRDGQRAVGVNLRVDWRSEAARLRLKIHSCMGASVNEYEVPFGVTERKAYADRFNSRGEWPAYRFACIEEPREAWGLALINRGTVGVEAGDGVLYTTLLRAPSREYAGMIPDETSSEHGVHDFEFLLAPYEGGWRDSGVIEWAQRFNNPPLIFAGAPRNGGAALKMQGDGVVLSAVLTTEAGDTAVRMYESCGRPATARVELPAGSRAWASDLNEKRLEELDAQGGSLRVELKPFEIKTLLFRQKDA